ncbi:hypothetical protein [Leptolyngbya sp. FACHB-1624]|uniref:hypothetical protein n=1 Tax=Leptolyngbya TaxID=47251 RepID=UPI001687096A|nr:hypothetical protein [Leptolyngbya sp. FACHB-1624]MBD1859222.1 hypothetical protein [Leptolyngbya sp. FACHB-1624]
MFKYNPSHKYLSSEELPDSRDEPVSELQATIPRLLKESLGDLWSDRFDWFFGIRMGIYYDPEEPAIVPDGFLSLGVERFIDEDLRLSYPLWGDRYLLPDERTELAQRQAEAAQQLEQL